MIATLDRPAIVPALAPSRAARGAAWFDEHHRDWWSPIDLKEFQVANYSRCPLAWVYADYEKGIKRVLAIMGTPRMGYSVLVDHGWDAPLGPDEDRAEYHRVLQVAWVKEILGRQRGRRN